MQLVNLSISDLAVVIKRLEKQMKAVESGPYENHEQWNELCYKLNRAVGELDKRILDIEVSPKPLTTNS